MRDQRSIFGAIEVLGVDSASVRGNLIENAVWGMTLIGQDMLVEGNHILDSTFKALDLEGVDTVVRNNSFQGSGETAWIGGEVDARENWWGSANGPSINGSSDGEALTITFGNATYSPWLQVPPARDSSCIPSETGAGVGAPASMRGQAMVGATVHVNEKVGKVHVKANEETEHAADTGEVPLG